MADAVNGTRAAHCPLDDGGHIPASNGTATNFVPHDSGPHGPPVNPASLSNPTHPIISRPILYVHAPPHPPPFLHYQWPMPFSYNPFAGFPGMSYGMMVPPPAFPVPPYQEAPAYILPHPHSQPVDYRRLLNPNLYSQVSQQNPNQTRRVHVPHSVPAKETANSGVQTEPTQRPFSGSDMGWQTASSDSGHETASISLSSPGSKSPNRAAAEFENHDLSCSDPKALRLNSPCTDETNKIDFNDPPTESNAGRLDVKERQIKMATAEQEPPPACKGKDGDCNKWLAESSCTAGSVCTSSQDEPVFKEKHNSVADVINLDAATSEIVLFKTPVKALSEDGLQRCLKADQSHESVPQKSMQKECDEVTSEMNEAITSPVDETLFKILRMPYSFFDPFSESREDAGELNFSEGHSITLREGLLYSLNSTQNVQAYEQVNKDGVTLEDFEEMTPLKKSFGSSRIKKKMNESVWSVESLAPFMPQECFLQTDAMEPKLNVLEAKSAAETAQSDVFINAANEGNGCRLFLCAADQICRRCHNVIDGKQNLLMAGSAVPAKEQEHSENIPSENGRFFSNFQLRKIVSTPTNEKETESSEPEAFKSPNQESLIVNDVQERSSCSSEEIQPDSASKKTNQSTGKQITQNGVEIEVNEVAVDTVQILSDTSPKAHLVDMGVQCTEIEQKCEGYCCSTGANKRDNFKHSDGRKTNKKAEAVDHQGYMTKNGPWRNRTQERHVGQVEPNNGYHKSGKSKRGRC